MFCRRSSLVSVSTVAALLLLFALSPLKAEEALTPLLQKADKGDVSAMYNAGVRLLKSGNKNDTQALKYLEKVAADSNSEYRNKARVWLGRAYRDSMAGIPKDSRRSFTYFEQAAGREGRDPEAQYELGKSYYLGNGTDRNLIAAYMWTSLSLKQSSPVSQQAEQQKQQLASLLNKVQLEKAQVLVTQLETVYLGQ